MTVPVGRNAKFIFAPVLLVVGGLVAWLGVREPLAARRLQIRDYPKLFAENGSCRPGGDPIKNAHRLEEHARLRAERYAYDPREGVRAVWRYQEADACYRVARDEVGARRAHRAGAALAHRVNTDFAAARLHLSNALQREQWSVALGEIRRLRLLTDHVGEHEYVEWLEEIIGRVTVEANAAS